MFRRNDECLAVFIIDKQNTREQVGEREREKKGKKWQQEAYRMVI